MRFRTLWVATALFFVAFAGAQTTDPTAALAEIQKFRTEKLSAAQAGQLSPAEIEKILADVQKKAQEAAAQFDPAKVDAKQCLALAEIYMMADDQKSACIAAERYTKSKPDAENMYRGFDIMLSACASLGEADMIVKTLHQYTPGTDTLKVMQATMTAYVYADAVAIKLGPDQAIALLDEQKNRIVGLTFAEENDKRMKSGALVGIADRKAELLATAGRQAEAIKVLDEAMVGLDARQKTMLTGAKTRLTLVGAASPSLPFERGYGSFDGLSAWKGKVVILDFFAHWCGPCIASFPEMKSLYAELKPKGLEMVGFTTYYGRYKQEQGLTKDAEFAKMGEFLKEHDLPWPVVYGERSVFEAFGVTGIPHVVILDREGKVHKIKVGYDPKSQDEFRAMLIKLLG